MSSTGGDKLLLFLSSVPSIFYFFSPFFLSLAIGVNWIFNPGPWTKETNDQGGWQFLHSWGALTMEEVATRAGGAKS